MNFDSKCECGNKVIVLFYEANLFKVEIVVQCQKCWKKFRLTYLLEVSKEEK